MARRLTPLSRLLRTRRGLLGLVPPVVLLLRPLLPLHD
jgi:hypothetical protein